MQNVLQLAEKMSANFALMDISIVHRLPSRNQSKERLSIVRFFRRVAKIEMLQKKKHLGRLQDLKHVKIIQRPDFTEASIFRINEIR